MQLYEYAQVVDDTGAMPQKAHAAQVLQYLVTIPKKKTMYIFVKRLMDILLSLTGLFLFSPFFLIVAIAIKLDSRGPAFFVHKRIGKKGTELRMYKFRTMVPNAEELIESFSLEQKREFEKNFKLDHDPRITRFGALLRRTSLDELPQLLNILKGDLSFVGPRPLVRDELERYGMHKYHFLSVKPGLTGNWQVNGRSATTYRERMELEMYYINNASLCLDIKIILKTIMVVLNRVGAK